MPSCWFALLLVVVGITALPRCAAMLSPLENSVEWKLGTATTIQLDYAYLPAGRALFFNATATFHSLSSNDQLGFLRFGVYEDPSSDMGQIDFLTFSSHRTTGISCTEPGFTNSSGTYFGKHSDRTWSVGSKTTFSSGKMLVANWQIYPISRDEVNAITVSLHAGNATQLSTTGSSCSRANVQSSELVSFEFPASLVNKTLANASSTCHAGAPTYLTGDCEVCFPPFVNVVTGCSVNGSHVTPQPSTMVPMTSTPPNITSAPTNGTMAPITTDTTVAPPTTPLPAHFERLLGVDVRVKPKPTGTLFDEAIFKKAIADTVGVSVERVHLFDAPVAEADDTTRAKFGFLPRAGSTSNDVAQDFFSRANATNEFTNKFEVLAIALYEHVGPALTASPDEGPGGGGDDGMSDTMMIAIIIIIVIIVIIIIIVVIVIVVRKTHKPKKETSNNAHQVYNQEEMRDQI